MTPPLQVLRISRIETLRRRHPLLLERLFTQAEWAWCLERRLADQHLAARLAAKRGVMALIGRRPFASIEVGRDPRGAPFLQVDGQAAALLVSLSHDGDLAVAAVAEKFPWSLR